MRPNINVMAHSQSIGSNLGSATYQLYNPGNKTKIYILKLLRVYVNSVKHPAQCLTCVKCPIKAGFNIHIIIIIIIIITSLST